MSHVPVKSVRIGELKMLARVKRLWTRSIVSALVFALYLSLSLLMFGRGTLLHLKTTLIAFGTDAATHAWLLRWWPYALGHGANPFSTTAIWAPVGARLGFVVSDAGPALLMSPVTLIFGPVVAYNVSILMAPALSGWAAYLLCHEASGKSGAALVGGYLFGFSSYEVGHLLGHLNLALVFPVPLLAYLALRHAKGRINSRRFVVLAVVTLTAQFLISTEVFFTEAVMGAIAVAVGVLVLREQRSALVSVARKLIGAYGLALAAVVPFIYFAFVGLSNPPIYSFYPRFFSTDVANFVIPTYITWLGHGAFSAVASQFSGNLSEETGYLGLPLVVLLFLFAAEEWTHPTTRYLVACSILAGLFTLGGSLHVVGNETVGLPWRAVESAPIFRYALPGRLTLYLFLVAAVIASLWLARARGAGWLRWGLAGLSIIVLLPNVSGGLWRTPVGTPQFFAEGAYRRLLPPDPNILVIPYGNRGNSMVWQAQAGFDFRMPEGNLSVTQPIPFQRDPILSVFYDGRLIPNFGEQIQHFVDERKINAIAVVDGTPGPWRTVFEPLGWRRIAIGGVELYLRTPGPSSKLSALIL